MRSGLCWRISWRPIVLAFYICRRHIGNWKTFFLLILSIWSLCHERSRMHLQELGLLLRHTREKQYILLIALMIGSLEWSFVSLMAKLYLSMHMLPKVPLIMIDDSSFLYNHCYCMIRYQWMEKLLFVAIVFRSYFGIDILERIALLEIILPNIGYIPKLSIIYIYWMNSIKLHRNYWLIYQSRKIKINWQLIMRFGPSH